MIVKRGVFMKKVFSLISAIFLGSLLVSCASIPKKVNPGDTLVIGRVEVKTHDYIPYEDIKINGTFHEGIEMTVKNVRSNKELIVKSNKDGCFFISNLVAGDTYEITHLKLTVYSNSGACQWIEVSFSNPRTFVPLDNQVLNIGCTYYDFDGANNWASWQTGNHNYVKEFFKDLPDESEWFEKEIKTLR